MEKCSKQKPSSGTVGLIVGALLGLGVAFLFFSSGGQTVSWQNWAGFASGFGVSYLFIFLLCPLSMVLMMKMMNKSDGEDRSKTPAKPVGSKAQ